MHIYWLSGVAAGEPFLLLMRRNIAVTHQEFIEAAAGYVMKYAPDYGIRVCSPIIAQAILESGWGESKLAKQCHNYFGLKCGSRWTGKSVNLKTKEECTPGTLTETRDNFRSRTLIVLKW